MKKLALIAAMGLAGCATEINVPVTGQIGDAAAAGNAYGNISGEGRFTAMTLDGLQCQGEYDPLSPEPTISSAVTCNDGRTGTVIITRGLDGLSGTAIGRLSDGTEARFVFGNLAYGQTGPGGAAQTIPVALR
jgi:hypothetical protein